VSEVQGEQEHEGQRQDGGDDQLRTRSGMMVVDVIPGRPAGGTPAFNHRSGALRTDQVLAAHRYPFRLACGPAHLALAAM
jgi:hypothetical protein